MNETAVTMFLWATSGVVFAAGAIVGFVIGHII